MDQFEYDITKHSAEEFKKISFFCTASGECAMEEVPDQETLLLKKLLDDRGDQGWEVVQLIFSKDGVMAFWKRRKA